MTCKKFYALVLFTMMIFFAAMSTSGCGGGGSSNFTDHEQQGTTFTIMFDTDGGTYIAPQTVETGKTANEPAQPEKDEYYFIGWYTNSGFSFPFDFDTPITRDIVLYAKWYDKNDTTDSDGDGLTDSLELTFGTDPYSVDTDNDGLTDYDELNWLNYNPLARDTDNNGIPDSDEDPDEDGLTNIQEANFGTNMIASDTDYDGLNDNEEILIYHTSPTNPDTDGDGVNDGVEVAIGTNPLVAENSFTTKLETTRIADGDTKAIDIAVEINSGPKGAGSLEISHADGTDSVFLSPYIPGYLGAAYKISAGDDINSASITFTIGRDVGIISGDFQPRIYYLDEATGALEELPDQIITQDGKITAEVSHFSIYILLNKIDFDAVWSTEIRPPLSGDSENVRDAVLDIVFVIDCSSSMAYNDSNRLAPELSKNFVSKLRDGKDKAAVVGFTTGASVLCDLTYDKTLLNSAIDRVSYGGLTDGSSGLNAALNILDNSQADYKFIIFLTDGEDTSRAYSYDNLIQRANDNNVVIYSIGMGDASEGILTNIATRTNGKYYHATADQNSGDILNLEDVFDDITGETVDLITDSNNDGISDYYTNLINNGTLKLSNGTNYLKGIVDICGNGDDWDNDGLKNGEEIEVRTNSMGIVCVFMNSDPMLEDSDGDGYSDYEEVKNMHTSPLKYTVKGDLWRLTDDEGFEIYAPEYIDLSREGHLMQYIFSPFEWQRIRQSKNNLINYFSDYTTTEALSRDAGVAERMQVIKNIKEGFTLAKDIISLTKEIADFAAEISSGKYTQASFDQAARKRLEDAGAAAITTTITLTGAIEYDLGIMNDASKSAIATAGELAAMVEYYDIKGKANAVKSAWKSVTGYLDIIKTASDDFADSRSILEQIDSGVNDAHKTFSAFTSLIKLSENFTRVEIPVKWEWANKNKGTVGNVVTILCDVADIVVSTLEVIETYGKIEANYAEYKKYMEVLRYIENNQEYPNYLRSGAQDITKIFNSTDDPDWVEFDKRVSVAVGQEIAAGVFKAVFDAGMIALTAEVPIVGLIRSVASKVISLSGLVKRAKSIINSQAYYGITEGCNSILSGIVNPNMTYFEFDQECIKDVAKYTVQLSQSRIVGLKCVLDYLLDGGVASWADRGGWGGRTKEETTNNYRIIIRVVYNAAKKCLSNLVGETSLSDKLPFYSEFGTN